MGDYAFGQMAGELVKTHPLFFPLILQNDYEQWKKEYTFDAIKNSVRYGQSFCNAFNITDNILYYERDAQRADARIRHNYVA